MPAAPDSWQGRKCLKMSILFFDKRIVERLSLKVRRLGPKVAGLERKVERLAEKVAGSERKVERSAAHSAVAK